MRSKAVFVLGVVGAVGVMAIACSSSNPPAGGEDAGNGSSSGSGSSSGAGADAGNWINMTNNPTGCDNKPGTPCGYAAANNGDGYTCICYNGTFSDGWGCEAPGSCVTIGTSCTAPADAPVCDGGVADSGADSGDGG